VNYFRKTFKTVSDAEEEFSIDYEDICTTNISDDSGFIEVATPYSVWIIICQNSVKNK
jgi:hypothetical protein